MATAVPEPIDPIEEELGLVLQDPDVRESLDDFERRLREGHLEEGRSHNEARKIVGLPPLPPDDPWL